MLDPFDIFQVGRSGNPPGDSGEGQSAIDRLAAEVRRLEQRADRMALVAQALWELLRERANLADQDLAARIREVDLRDGTADGRMTPVAVECPSCHRHSNSRREECVYCGSPLPGRNLLERL